MSFADFGGDGGAATSARLNLPSGLAVDGSGNTLIADAHNRRIRRVAADSGIITTLAGTGATGYGGDGGPATSAVIDLPQAVALDGRGNVLFADTYNHRIRQVTVGTGIITTLAGTGVASFGGDGGPATSAGLRFPHALAVENSGNVLIADTENHRIRRVALGTSVITTLAGTGVAGYNGDGGPATSANLHNPIDLALDESGNVLFADHNNHRIRRVAIGTGVITTLAGTGVSGFSGDGGPATSAQLQNPHGLALDASGRLYIADWMNNRVRQVAPGTGIITTLAGTGVLGFSGDGGPATSARLHAPRRVAVANSGAVLITDEYNHRIRQVFVPISSPPPAPSPSTTPYCIPTLFRPLPRTDLVGVLVGTALAPGEPVVLPSVAACRQACCDAAACDGYAFDASGGRLGAADCFLYVNITQLVPVSMMASGVRESVLL